MYLPVDTAYHPRTYVQLEGSWRQQVPRNTSEDRRLNMATPCFVSALIIGERRSKVNVELRHRWARTQWILKNTNDTINIKLRFSHVEKHLFQFNNFTSCKLVTPEWRNLLYLTKSNHLHWNLKKHEILKQKQRKVCPLKHVQRSLIAEEETAINLKLGWRDNRPKEDCLINHENLMPLSVTISC